MMLSDRIAKSQYEAGYDASSTLSELDTALGQHEQLVQSIESQAADDTEGPSAVEEARRQLSGSYVTAGEAAYEIGQYEHALRYYRREEELTGKLERRGYLLRAASLAALGRMDEAKPALRSISGPVVTNGQCRAYFQNCREFDEVREDPDILAIVGEWEQVEAISLNYS